MGEWGLWMFDMDVGPVKVRIKQEGSCVMLNYLNQSP